MFRPDHPTAIAGQYTEGSVAQGIPATVVTAEHLNAITNELVAVATGVGNTLDKNNNGQVWQAILALHGNPVQQSQIIENFLDASSTTLASSLATLNLFNSLIPSNGHQGVSHNMTTLEEIDGVVSDLFLPSHSAMATIWVHREGAGMHIDLKRARGSTPFSFMAYIFGQYDGQGGDAQVTCGQWDPVSPLEISLKIQGVANTATLTKIDNNTLRIRRSGNFAGTGDTRFNLGFNGMIL